MLAAFSEPSRLDFRGFIPSFRRLQLSLHFPSTLIASYSQIPSSIAPARREYMAGSSKRDKCDSDTVGVWREDTSATVMGGDKRRIGGRPDLGRLFRVGGND